MSLKLYQNAVMLDDVSKNPITVFQYNQYFDDCVYCADYQLTISALDFLLTCLVIRGCLWKLWEITHVRMTFPPGSRP